jgi:hypothetical protein
VTVRCFICRRCIGRAKKAWVHPVRPEWCCCEECHADMEREDEAMAAEVAADGSRAE